MRSTELTNQSSRGPSDARSGDHGIRCVGAASNSGRRLATPAGSTRSMGSGAAPMGTTSPAASGSGPSTGKRVGAPRPQHRRYADAAAHGKVAAQPGPRRAQSQRPAGGQLDGDRVIDGHAVHLGGRRRAGHGDNRVHVRSDGQPAERALDARPHRSDCQPARFASACDARSAAPDRPTPSAACPIRPASWRSAKGPGRTIVSPGDEPGAAGACTRCRCGLPGGRGSTMKRTALPGRMAAGGSAWTSHSGRSVLPMICQPPGEARG